MHKSVLFGTLLFSIYSLALAGQSAIDPQGAVTNIQSPRNNSDAGIVKNDIYVNSFGHKVLLAQSDYERELREQREQQREHEDYVGRCLLQCEQTKYTCNDTCSDFTTDANTYEQCNANCERDKMTCEGMCQ